MKGGLYFLSRTRNATAFPMVIDRGFTTPEQLRQAADGIDRDCPAVGLWDHRLQSDPIESSSLRPLYRHIERDYGSPGRVQADIELFTRKPGGGCGKGGREVGKK
jgi:hypothetical protein